MFVRMLFTFITLCLLATPIESDNNSYFFAKRLEAQQPITRKIIIISYDGLRPDVLTSLGEEKIPNFYRSMREGAFTLNARTDPDWTVTIPNHVTMITGRGVSGIRGHNYVDNSSASNSIHQNKGKYVHSIFDAAAKQNKKSGFFASKAKFQVFLESYSPDFTSLTASDTQTFNTLIEKMSTDLPELNFVHFANTDEAGHSSGWAGTDYINEVLKMDERLGIILNKIESEKHLSKTALIITADHGGENSGHNDNSKLLNFRIPFIVWGKDTIGKGKNLYRVNRENGRKNPGLKQKDYKSRLQPIRNGDVANAAMKFLELEPVRNSTIGKKMPLLISVAD